MNYKKKYKKALERAKDFMNGEVHYALRRGENIMCWIFPELRESEDERIRKWLIRDIKQSLDDGVYNDESIDSAKEALAWLEKQGDSHKPTWSEEDERMIESIIRHLESQKNYQTNTTNIEQCQDWLKSLKPQKLEWSEEDKKLLNDAISLADECDDIELRDWLKSLRDR